ncbi:hypothetical protein RhiirA4_461811 [Rhizophagus irregularis]|uniref:Uncharacterized protein n=1 Tax=Rhizophagus irregularis TaxID=588596 RepID=A0A2I1GJP4_9GLOM|nr:hypothetical protein RhiirA4_461811 [Rhizophagus irregularis]
MILVNCAVKENQTVLDTSSNVNCISEKSVDGKVNLYITFNDDKKHKSIPSEFIVVGPDWPDHFPDF